jgi:hypothetical protein
MAECPECESPFHGLPCPRTKLTPIQETEQSLMIKLERVLGYTPIGTKDLLHVLTHPDIIDLTEEYVRAKRLEE